MKIPHFGEGAYSVFGFGKAFESCAVWLRPGAAFGALGAVATRRHQGERAMRLIAMLAIVLGACGALVAQDAQNPFGAAAAGAPGAAPANPFGGSQPAGPAASPFGGPAGAAKPKRPKAKPTEDELPPLGDEKDPVVLAIRESNPTAPADLMFAVRTLFEMDRPKEAKHYLKKLLAAAPNQQTLVGFHRELGPGFFFRLERAEPMQPEGKRLAEAVRKAAYRASRDPARLRTLVKQLSDPSFTVRLAAVDGLRAADTAAVAPLLEALADPNRAGEHPQIRAAFVDLGEPMIEPLLGALDAPDQALRIQVMQTLGQFRTARAIPLLVGPFLSGDAPAPVREAAARALVEIVGQVPTRFDVEQYLYRRAKAFLDGAPPGRVDYRGRITLWQWDAEQKACVAKRYPAADAALMMAARLSRELYRIAPDNPDFRRLFLVANLEFAKIQTGLGRPLPKGPGTLWQQASSLGVDAIEDVLVRAMANGRAAAAIAAAELLGAMGDGRLLASEDGRPRPLAAALQHSDRRVRMAAAEAIMRFDPKRPYAGSSFLPETFGYVIRTVGAPRALVAHPRVEKSQTLVGMLEQIGYRADAARTGRETFLLAAKHPDYEFVLISDALDYPDANETVQMLRHDPRTSRLAVGLMAREANVERARRTAELDPLLEAFPRPHNATMMAYQVSRLLDLAGRNRLGFEERLAQASRALDHLARLARHPEDYSFYDLYRQQDALLSALFTPELSVQAAVVLGYLGTPEAQRALVTLASQHARPLAERQAAAKGFAVAVQRRGLLLTREEILVQYDRYNRSETLDRGTQQVLGSVLDAIEMPSKKAAEKKRSEQEQTAAASQPG